MEISKKKIILLLLGGIGFVFFSILFIIKPTDFVNSIIHSQKMIFIAGIAGLIFFGLGIIMLFIKLFDKNPGLIIDEEGIIDNTNSGSVGFIKWSDITEVTTKKIASTELILLQVKNPEEYISKANRLKKLSLKQNINNYGTPITLTSVVLQCSFNELEEIILESYKKYK